MEFKEFSAKTADEAIIKASIELGVSSENLEIQVVTEGSSGFFGIGKKPAIIKARRKEETLPEEPVAEEIKESVPVKKEVKKTDKAAEKPVEETVKPVRHQETKKEQPKPREEKKIIKRSEEEIAEIKKTDPADACFDLVLEERGRVDEINFGMCEDDVEYIMKKPYVMIGSDGKAVSFDYPGRPHPRFFGAFPRVISHYCRDRGLFTLEEAVNKMTAMPATRLGIGDRGMIKEGMWADLVLFDFEGLCDNPDFEDPKQPCGGIKRVYVNGVLTSKDGIHTGARAGRVLRKRI